MIIQQSTYQKSMSVMLHNVCNTKTILKTTRFFFHFQYWKMTIVNQIKWIKHTFVQASGWSFKVVKTSWAIFCWSPEPEYKVPTTLSRSPMSNFWLKSKSWLTVSWANTVAMMLLSFKHWKSWKKLRFHEIFGRFFVMFVTLARRQKFMCVTGVNQITPVFSLPT